MRIFIVTSELYPVTGGIAHYVRNFSNALVEEGHEVVIFGVSRSSELKKFKISKELSLTVILTPLSQVNSIASISYYNYGLSYAMCNEVINYIEINGKPDIIEVQEVNGIAYFLLKQKLLGCLHLQNTPISLTLHTPEYILFPSNGSPSYKLPLWWIGQLEKWCTVAADAIVSPSQALLDRTQNEIHLSIIEKAEVIPLPLDMRLLKDTNKIYTQPTRNDVLFYGRLDYVKGVVELITGCQQLWDRGMDFCLTMIGNSCYYPLRSCDMKEFIMSKYQKYIDMGLLVLEPAMQKPALYERVATAWCVIIPSLWENFPNVCMESMLLQKVVLANKNGGSKEMINYGDQPSGFIFDWQIEGDFAEKLEKVLDLSLEENIKIGKNARESMLKMCSPEQVIPQRIGHFERVIESCKTQKIHPSLIYSRINHPKSLQPLGVEGKISVFISYCNSAKYIRETLDSIYQVNYADLEVIIWDEGSTEVESIRVLAEVQQEYAGLQVYFGKGQDLVEVSSGEYLAFLNADDKIHPDYYPKAVSILNRYENVGMVSCWIQNFGKNEEKKITWDGEFPFLLCHNHLGSAVLVKKSVFAAIGGMKVELLKAGETKYWECWINMHKQGWLGVVIPEFYHFCRVKADSKLNGISQDIRLKGEEEVVKHHAELYQLYGHEIFSLCNQNQVAPTYWSTSVQRYNLPEVRVEVREVETIVEVHEVETIVEVRVPDTQKSRMGAKDISFYSAKTLTKAMIWKILRKGAKILNVSKSVKRKFKAMLSKFN